MVGKESRWSMNRGVSTSDAERKRGPRETLQRTEGTVLEVFRSRRIVMYDHKKLVRDLQRLVIVEKSYGYKLEAARTQDSHADTAIALAIALPLAVEEAGHPPFQVGAIDLYAPAENDYLSPYQQAMREHKSRAQSYQSEMDYLAKQGADYSGRAGWEQAMRGRFY